jgi:FixJ family two-component response regulator
MSNHRPIKVAVVDDDASLCRAVQRHLAASGIECECFLSAEQFLESRTEAEPDCVLLDVQLGGMSGFELQRKLADEGRDLPIIFVTAHDEPDAREQALSAGCVAFLRKTDPAETILEAIRSAAGLPHVQSR